MEEKTQIIEGLDIIDVVNHIDKKSRSYQAIMLQDIEQIISKDDPRFGKVRKVILDNLNEYTRSLLRMLFGVDYEGKIE